MLATAETHYAAPPGRDLRPSERAPKMRGVVPFTDEYDRALVIEVYANHGRWIAECVSCVGAQFASRTDPRFLCSDCGNVQIGGKWVRLVWPKNVEAIEAVLDRRPMDARNWRPGETVAALLRENVEHGIEEA